MPPPTVPPGSPPAFMAASPSFLPSIRRPDEAGARIERDKCLLRSSPPRSGLPKVFPRPVRASSQ